MKLKLLFLILFFSIGCSTPTKIQLSKKEIKAREGWVKTYKQVVFKRCLLGGLNPPEGCREIFLLDNSSPQDFPFGVEGYRYINSLAKIPILAAKKDSTEFYEWYFKGMNEIEKNELNGLPIFRHCLDFYTSSELDSIARSRIKQFAWLWKN